MATPTIWTTNPRPLSRYSTVAILLHWAIAALILFNLATGFFHHDIPRVAMAIHISSGITILILSVARLGWRLGHRPPPFASDMALWEKGLAHLVHGLLYLAMILMPLTAWAMLSATPPPGSPGAAAAAAMPARPGHAHHEDAHDEDAHDEDAHQEDAHDEDAHHGDAHHEGAAPRGAPSFWFVVDLPLIAPLQEIGRTPQGLPAQTAKRTQIEGLHELGGWIMLGLLVLHVAGALKHQFVDRRRQFARMGIGVPDHIR